MWLRMSRQDLTVSCELTTRCTPMSCVKKAGSVSSFSLRHAGKFLQRAQTEWASDAEGRCRIRETPSEDGVTCRGELFPFPLGEQPPPERSPRP